MEHTTKAKLHLTIEVNAKGEERLLIEREGEFKDFASMGEMLKELSSSKENAFLAKEILSLMSTLIEYAR